MKRLKYFVWIVCIIFFTQLSCTDNYESLPVDRFTDEFVFSTTDSTGKQARQFLNMIYEQLPDRHNGAIEPVDKKNFAATLATAASDKGILEDDSTH